MYVDREFAKIIAIDAWVSRSLLECSLCITKNCKTQTTMLSSALVVP